MSGHQKRVTIPKSWPIARKTSKWVAKLSPGPHSAKWSMPLLLVARDMLKLADNAREVKRILYEGQVLVNGKPRRDEKFPVGIFDVISVPALNKQWRMLKNTRGQFTMVFIGGEKASRLVRIDNKTLLKGGKLQLNLSDGTNLLAEGEYHTGDSLVLSLGEAQIEDVISLQPGHTAMVVGGSHTGQVGQIKEILVTKSSMPNRVIISGEQDFETIIDYVYMVGKQSPIFDLGDLR
ncbi:MAG: 30S ribosomal protein S4E [Methanosaeta sp. PtaB.Bin039]|nr:MAG: 30S ribosomal protein S4E [Methanosaeta sp. PtaB.Bin039]HOT07484.1 30S ribosomal protein S4e [Methanotrichaceae archaeon]HQF16991.1 30S ribosomal protein S4e [Methanotrichaceae archaeon]HQI91611.1 30S ribosomal protein S4e [Methanotrichaceae archaeon]HQJ28895.1 30S ribosomal protein S4e [Methanotrichaceae archaeon]